MTKLFSILILFITHQTLSQDLKIGIMRKHSSTTVLVSYHKGSYNVWGDSLKKHTILPTESVEIRVKGNKLQLIRGITELGFFDTIRIKESLPNHSFRIQILKPYKQKERKYKNDLMFVLEQNKKSSTNRIKTINCVSMQNYLGGVIESEGGGGRHIEYYKVQAVLSRTYALRNSKKHIKEGFNLCDRVHCQAYHKMLIYTPKIDVAVKATKSIIMIDKNYKLADGFFFANCGGQTSESDFVWNKAISYCRSIKDTFCIHTRQSNWTKKIKKSDWDKYLKNHFGYPIHDPYYGPLIYSFKQKQRLAFYHIPQLGIPLRDLRKHFKLRSTWFDVYLEGDFVVLKGHGFGHGVGLCQEGAMEMAKQNYSYDKILSFYFSQVHLINYFKWKYYQNLIGNKIEL